MKHVSLQDYIRSESAKTSIVSTTFRFRRDPVVRPRKRKLDEQERKSCENGEGERDGDEVTAMFCPFVRKHYKDGQDIPKVCRHINTLEMSRS